MTNLNNDVIEAINDRDAHALAEALGDLGVSATRSGNRGADDEACEIDGYGIVFFQDVDENAGWVVRAFTDDCDYPLDDDAELRAELERIVGDVQRIA